MVCWYWLGPFFGVCEGFWLAAERCRAFLVMLKKKKMRNELLGLFGEINIKFSFFLTVKGMRAL